MSGAIYPSLKGRLVVVTGGGSGIGAGFTEAFARQGARVEHVIGNVRRMELDQLAAYVAATGLQNTYLASDYGQKHNPLPVSGYMFTARRLLDAGWSEDDVRRFVAGTAGELIDGIV